MYETLLSPITIRGMTLKNRLVFAPAQMRLKEEEYFSKIRAAGQGGAGLIVAANVSATRIPFRCLYTDKGFEYYRRLAECIHRAGARASAQLYVADINLRGMIKYIPKLLAGKVTREEIHQIIFREVSEYVDSLPVQEIEQTAGAFATAAVLARRAGFDMVQIQGDKLVGSFFSPLFNHRTDAYGGTAQKRAKFACEIVVAIRNALPELPVDFKLPVRQENPHYGNAGVLVEELGVTVPLLEQAGVDCLHVTLANHSDLSDPIPAAGHPYFGEEGCFLKYCDAVRRFTELPVCGVGGLATPAFVERQLKTGRIQLAGMCRQLLADPQWLAKAAQGREEQIRTCTRCNELCLKSLQEFKGVHCIFEQKE